MEGTFRQFKRAPSSHSMEYISLLYSILFPGLVLFTCTCFILVFMSTLCSKFSYDIDPIDQIKCELSFHSQYQNVLTGLCVVSHLFSYILVSSGAHSEQTFRNRKKTRLVYFCNSKEASDLSVVNISLLFQNLSQSLSVIFPDRKLRSCSILCICTCTWI